MTVTPEKLYEKKIIRKISGKMPVVKILGGGELTKKVNVTGCVVSGVAKEKIEKLGGVIS
jgi:ribosomal protein L15